MKRPGTPPPLLFFPEGERGHTFVGMPPPMHLPALPVRKSYAERYPPQLDAPVVVGFVPTDEDTVVVEPTCINCGRPNHTFQQMLTCSQVGLDAMRARRRKP